MLGLNHIQIIGNLGSTPEMRFLNDSEQVVYFPVAVNERWKNRDGEPQEKTTWLRIVAFSGVGRSCAEYLTKGQAVYVEGRLQIREYEDKDGDRHTSVEVVASRVRFLGRGNNGHEDKEIAPGDTQGPKGRSSAPRDAATEEEDAVPF